MTHGAAWPSTATSLILRLRHKEDEEAWRLFVQVYTPLVYRYCRRRGLQDADACDVTQEVIKRVSAKMPGFEYDPAVGKFRGWLGALTRHELHTYGERRAKHGRAEGGDQGAELLAQTPEDDPLWLEEFQTAIYEAALARVAERWPAEEWRAFLRVWVDQQKPAAVARELNLELSRLYKLKFRILEQLRAEVAFLTADEPTLQR